MGHTAVVLWADSRFPSGMTERKANAKATLRLCLRAQPLFVAAVVRLSADEGDAGEFGGTVQAEGQADRADAAVDVELHVSEVEEAFDVLLAHGGKDQRADEGKADLAAVGVTGEHEVDERKARVVNDLVHVVGLVAHEENGGAGVGGDGEVEIGRAGGGVVGAAEPEDVAATLEGGVAVDEDGGSMRLEWCDDVFGANGDIVVAEDAEALRGFEGGEDLGTEAGGPPGDRGGARSIADEVSGDQDEVGGEGVDLGDHAFKEEGLGVLLEVNVAHLDDAEALEGVGEIVDGEGAVGDLELVAGVGSGVSGQSEAGSGGGIAEKAAARDGGRFRVRGGVRGGGRTTVHSP